MSVLLRRGWLRLRPPAELLARLRWFFLLFGQFYVVTYMPLMLWQSERPWWVRGLAAAVLTGMGAWWLRCFRLQRFPAAGLLLECAAFAACVLTPSDPFKGLGLLYIAVNFRALYGTLRQVLGFAAVATACFVAAVLAAPHLGSMDRTALVAYVLPGVVPLAVIAHLVAVASSRSVRSAARERLLARTGLAMAQASDAEAATNTALAAAADIVADCAGTVTLVAARTPTQDAESVASNLEQPVVVNGWAESVLHVRTDEPLADELRDAVSLIAAQLGLTLSNIRLTEDLRRQAGCDPLTGLANRRAAMEGLVQALAAPPSADDAPASRVGIVMIDLDGFKEVNDGFGHAAGDLLLISLAHRLQQQVRGSDLLGRLGGDEFVLVMPSVRAGAEVAVIAERLLRSIGEPVPIEGRAVTVGASIGIAVAAAGDDAATVLSAADEAMYEAKRSGRNRICAARGSAGDSAAAAVHGSAGDSAAAAARSAAHS